MEQLSYVNTHNVVIAENRNKMVGYGGVFASLRIPSAHLSNNFCVFLLTDPMPKRPESFLRPTRF